MREIKFRAKQIEHGEMAFGLIICNYAVNCWYIENEEGRWKIVDRDTVGQFTGLYDRNGKEIYEGDIIRDIYSKKYGKVIWDASEVCFTLLFSDGAKWGFVVTDNKDKDCKVVGNIYENPELLNEKEATQ